MRRKEDGEIKEKSIRTGYKSKGKNGRRKEHSYYQRLSMITNESVLNVNVTEASVISTPRFAALPSSPYPSSRYYVNTRTMPASDTLENIVVKPKRFQCPRCQRRFARLEHLQRHERTRMLPTLPEQKPGSPDPFTPI
jgi:uncharacterized Zn-finger protein